PVRFARQNVQRVAPCGSAVATPVITFGVNRYRCHGGGPALGALNGAVNASPATSAGQPPARYRAATASSVGPSVTRAAAPSSTRSMPLRRTDTVHAGLAARSRDLRILGPLVKYRPPSCQRQPTPAACGAPSGPTVPRKNVTSGPELALRASWA